jgi:hypothetical protein
MTENLVFVAKSTIKVQFPEGNDKPGYVEMRKFTFELGLEASDIDSMYQEYTAGGNGSRWQKLRQNEIQKILTTWCDSIDA